MYTFEEEPGSTPEVIPLRLQTHLSEKYRSDQCLRYDYSLQLLEKESEEDNGEPSGLSLSMNFRGGASVGVHRLKTQKMGVHYERDCVSQPRSGTVIFG